MARILGNYDVRIEKVYHPKYSKQLQIFTLFTIKITQKYEAVQYF